MIPSSRMWCSRRRRVRWASPWRCRAPPAPSSRSPGSSRTRSSSRILNMVITTMSYCLFCLFFLPILLEKFSFIWEILIRAYLAKDFSTYLVSTLLKNQNNLISEEYVCILKLNRISYINLNKLAKTYKPIKKESKNSSLRSYQFSYWPFFYN